MLLLSGDVWGDGTVVLRFYDPASCETVHVCGGEFRPYFFTTAGGLPLAGARRSSSGPAYDTEDAIRTDLTTGEDKAVTKVSATPADYALVRALATDVWEGRLRHVDSYYYDRGLVPGRLYDVLGSVVPPAALAARRRAYVAGASGDWEEAHIAPHRSGDDDAAMLTRLEGEIMPRLRADKSLIDLEGYEARLRAMVTALSEAIPEIRRCAVDIEVGSGGGRNPDAARAEYPVTAVGIHAPDRQIVLMTGRAGADRREREIAAAAPPSPPVPAAATGGASTARAAAGKVRVVEFGSEAEMLKEAFRMLSAYPCILTYYGDEFDIPYLYNRARKIGAGDAASALLAPRGNLIATVRPMHLDLYKVFANPALHAYAFGAKYGTFGLGAVAEAMLGEGKTGSGAETSDMSADDLAAYCHNDARLTYALSAFSDSIVMRLLVTIARLSSLSVDAVSRTRVSTWIQGAMYAEHRRTGSLVPRFDDLQERAGMEGRDSAAHDRSGSGSSGGGHQTKKYKGAIVLPQVAGVHWGMTVLDFASMYPHVIHRWNLSYETVRCPHAECRASNPIPGTDHWHCTRRAGMLASIIGAMREMRVSYYKPLARDKSLSEERRGVFSVIEQSLKVMMNASYGVMGSDLFAMYFLPVAESTTAVGRHIITATADECGRRGMRVLGGDTDSLFVGRADQKDIDGVIEAAKAAHGADLEVDKRFRYAILTGRKKNYLGVREDGTCDLKGLTGKKSHTPQFVRGCFDGVLARLSAARDEAGIEEAKKGIVADVTGAVNALRAGDVPIGDLLFRVRMTKGMGEYGAKGKGGDCRASRNATIDAGGAAAASGAAAGPPKAASSVPQHVAAAMELRDRFGVEVRDGDTVSYVKTVRPRGASPYECVAREDVDAAKYAEFLASTLDQVLVPLGIDAKAVIDGCSSMRMEEFFG